MKIVLHVRKKKISIKCITCLDGLSGVWGKFNLDISTHLGFMKYDLVKYSICDFEYLFRKIFQQTYELECDRGHQIWNNNLLYGSVIRPQGIIRQYWRVYY